MAKRWVSVGIGLILVGIGGAALYGFNFGDDIPSYQEKWTFGDNELSRLSIEGDLGAMDVRFLPSTNGVNSIEIEGQAEEDIARSVHNSRIRDGLLDLNLKPAGTHFFNLNFKVFKTEQSVTVRLTPEAASSLEQLTLSNDAGSLRVSGAKAQSADISTDAGIIDIDDFDGTQLKLASDAGKISVADIHADLDIKSDFGRIRAERVVGSMVVSADTGSIQIEHLTGTAKLSVDSGSVKLLKDDTSSADIKTDTGSVSVQLPSSYGGSFDLKTDSGSVHAPDAKGTTDDKIKVRTDTGSIRITEVDE
jgi:DUF4097 and DUF4098 domain-containing protein YvlB